MISYRDIAVPRSYMGMVFSSAPNSAVKIARKKLLPHEKEHYNKSKLAFTSSSATTFRIDSCESTYHYLYTVVDLGGGVKGGAISPPFGG